MAFSDPQSITVNAVAQSLPRTVVDGSTSQYTKDDQSFKLSISHTYAKRNRHTVRIQQRKIAADPFSPSVNQEYTQSAYIVLDVPPTGFSVTEQQYIVTALADWLKASTNAVKVIGGES